MIVWLNGPFGVGKTSTAEQLCRAVPGAALFDPELVGDLVTGVVPAVSGDFQDLAAWRRIVLAAVLALHDEVPSALVVPMTVLDRRYLADTVGQLRAPGRRVLHVLVHASGARLRERIEAADPEAPERVRYERMRWRHAHADRYAQAFGWLRARADLVVDSSERTPAAVAGIVAGHLDRGSAG